ncbi:hypothetical protein Pmar_PMAR000158 [Perkinsus marinus ATCC 50983]|uniref:Uncharacterized protein n=1 Tax=Perkinsus marinus (strain ATCC 50983 / TXsc) TaxID=423536 RepID=C5LUT9_PERM5|nr:hypothetical protein Pmar_PMAR000158 [Perkinsus marinus ATCC 50983]EEQ99503.1 hypothetical protein Pmar_PMAR000158 [Perkinsus marinus ATCC 50983]|eukprot:XP_002766786.1 hypothetical protein Pmar_PMAR000158 [Perkinsus marinus ATCC 50983]
MSSACPVERSACGSAHITSARSCVISLVTVLDVISHGLCGEPCPLCPVCYHDVACGISFEDIGSAVATGGRVYTLPECGHTFYLDGLDQYMEYNPTRGEHQAIQLRACPVCREPIFTAPRYGNIIKAQLELVARVKERLIVASRELTLQDRQEINRAMQSERGVLGAAAGHWSVDIIVGPKVG